MLVLLLACHSGDDTSASSAETVTEAPLSDPLMETGLLQAVNFALQADVTAPWRGLAAANARSNGACPASYPGEPPDNDLPGTGSMGAGESWSDSCESGATEYRGYMYWEYAASVSRLLIGDSVVGEGDEVLYEFDGTATDSYTTTASGWEYESSVAASIGGSLTYGGTATPGGLQEDLYVYYTGGAESYLEATGNIYLYADLLAGLFDSVWLDIEYDGPGTTDPEACTLEPRGTIGVRDADAHWYYIVFEPKYNSTVDFDNAEYSSCDGCGTAYYRGFEQGTRLCPDFSTLWDVLAPPAATEFPL